MTFSALLNLYMCQTIPALRASNAGSVLNNHVTMGRTNNKVFKSRSTEKRFVFQWILHTADNLYHWTRSSFINICTSWRHCRLFLGEIGQNNARHRKHRYHCISFLVTKQENAIVMQTNNTSRSDLIIAMFCKFLCTYISWRYSTYRGVTGLMDVYLLAALTMTHAIYSYNVAEECVKEILLRQYLLCDMYC